MPTVVKNAPSCSARRAAAGPAGAVWKPLTPTERSCVLGVGALIAGLGVFRICPGIQESDNGDFQLACATMGIAHPPGYFGYALIGWLWTRLLFFVDPAYAVQLGCTACVAASLMFGCALLIHAGCHGLLAAGIALLPVQHAWFWYSITCAEIYAPSLLLLALVVYLLYRYGRQGRAWQVYLAAVCYGFLAVNRPPAVFYLPGVVAALLLIERRRGTGWSKAGRRLACTAGVAALVGVTVLVYGLSREDPSTAYNYVDQYAETHPGVPGDDGTMVAAVERLAWLIRAREFDDLKGADAGQTRSKLRWIRRQLLIYDTSPFVMALLGIGLGCFALTRQNADLVVLLMGIVAGSVGFQLQYRAFDFASDLLPVIWSLVIIVGAYLGRVLPRGDKRPHKVAIAAAMAVGIGAWVVGYGATRYSHGQTRWREPFLEELDFQSFPQRSVFIADWGLSRALLYEKLVRHPRPDIKVIRSDDRPNWRDYVMDFLDRPLYYTMEQPPPAGYELRPVRNVFEVVKKGVRE